MMSQIKCIYFDIGGVLVDYKHDLQKLAEDNGITVGDFDVVFDGYDPKLARGELTLQDLWKGYHDELHLKEPTDFDFLQYWTDHLTPIEENHTLLQELAKTYDVSIISNLYTDVFPQLLKKRKIPNIPYHTIINSSEIKYIKPEKEIYQIAQKKANYSPEEILYIDDNKDFIAIAKSLGWKGIWYEKANGDNLEKSLSQFLDL